MQLASCISIVCHLYAYIRMKPVCNLTNVTSYGSVVPVSSRDPSKFQHQVNTYVLSYNTAVLYSYVH